MRSSVVCDESNAFPISGSATLATARFRFATAATRMSEIRTSLDRSGAVDASPARATPTPGPGSLVIVVKTYDTRTMWCICSGVDAGSRLDSKQCVEWEFSVAIAMPRVAC